MEKQILHIDVNNAFLSWTAIEMLKNGSKIDIREIPAIIGGDETKRSGVVLAKSMKAKECGIHTGESIYHAKMKCPNIEIYRSNYKIYKKYSDSLYNLLRNYTDKIERYSIDECFLDMTKYLRGRKLIDIAKEISKKVKKELKFTVNIGVANNKLLAKMASDFQKPDRVHTLYNSQIEEKMWKLPVSELFMLGRKTVPKLNNMGIKTIGDLAKSNKEIIIKKFGKHGLQMWEYANGIDNSEVISKPEKPKCISNEITLAVNITQTQKLQEILLALSEQVAYRVRKNEMLGEVIAVQLRTNEFQDKTHQRKLGFATDNTAQIYQTAKILLKEMYNEGTPIRLVGLRVSNLVEKQQQQLSLFETKQDEKQKEIDKTLDKIKEKYGYQSITRAGEMNVKGMLKWNKL